MASQKKFYNYFTPTLAIFLPPLLFIILFQIWKVDLSQLIFNYNTDALLAAFSIKSIIDSGWFFSNNMIGFPHIAEKFYFHDFPVHADFLNFVIIKIFTLFSSDPFFILNGFFILTLSLTSLTSFIVLRHFKISNFTALIISILFAFTPYHLFRNTIHLFLSNYMVIPLIIMVALWITSDKIQIFGKNKKGQFCFKANNYFFGAFLICCIAASTGVYYALYGCLVFLFACFFNILKKGEIANQSFFVTAFLCATIFTILFLLHLPSLFYWVSHGLNQEVAGRSATQSYTYGLKIVSLFLPVENHYLEYFANVRKAFDALTIEIETPSESLGIIGSIGLLFLLIWPIAKSFSDEKTSFFQRTIQKFSLKKDDQDLISKLASINLFIILFATVGGFIMFIALPFPLLRSHARFSIFIAFLALFLIAIIFDKILERKTFNPVFAKSLILVIFTIALFDQIGRVSANSIQSPEMRNQFNSNRDFIKKIEQEIPAGSMIFQLPITTFPEGGDYSLVLGYVHSKNLRWSFPVIKGRESAIWQEKVVKLNFKEFISELKKAGFAGIYIDRNSVIISSEIKDLGKTLKDLLALETQLKSIAKRPPLFSGNSQLVFFEI